MTHSLICDCIVLSPIDHLEPESEKKAGVHHHPASVDNSLDEEREEQIEEEEEEEEEVADFNASLVIGALLIIPIIIIVSIALFLRLRKNGTLRGVLCSLKL